MQAAAPRFLPRKRASTDDPNFSTKFVGFDTGPGNVLMDLWVARHWQRAYDENGQLAAKGHVDEELLDRMLRHDYFSRPYPKSTGRDLFNDVWLNAQLCGDGSTALSDPLAALQDRSQQEQRLLDILATLLALTARSVALHLNQASFSVTQVFVVDSLRPLRCLSHLLPTFQLLPVSLGAKPHHIRRSSCAGEACAIRRSCSSCSCCAHAQLCPHPNFSFIHSLK